VDGVILDRIDKGILRELAMFNCRASYRSLARKFNLSPNAIKNRVTKMIEDGVIIKFYVRLVNEITGIEALFGLIFTDGAENREEFVSRIGSNPMIHTVCTLITIEGGAYFVFGGCTSPNQLAELGAMLRRFNHVQKVEIHRGYRPFRGRKIDFSKAQLKVMSCLYQDARMTIEEIAKRSGMAAKTVRRILRQLEQGNGIYYSSRLNLSAGGLVDVWVRIDWDDKLTSIDEIFHWLKSEYPDDLWMCHISASDSVMFADFILNDITKLEQISSKIREAPFVRSTTSLAAFAQSSFFEGLRDIKMTELLEGAGV
jgi:DNA-binding Lrp family transcriptional regulator